MSCHRCLLFFSTLALLALALPAGSAPQQPPAATAAQTPAPAASFVGSDVCAACHGDVAEHLKDTPHGKSTFASMAPQGCETCHGPGSAHAQDPQNPALQPRITKLDVKAQSQVCQKCHSGGGQFFWHGSVHETRNLSCVSCHGVHTFKSPTGQLKAASTVEACVTCHKDVRAQMWKSSHHPIREGKITCTDCHNPHGSTTPKLIRANSVNEQCTSCHADKRGPFLWEHPPVLENCLNCHTPHGSNHIKLQKTSVPYLCQQCHANIQHPSDLYDRTTQADVPQTPDGEGGANNRLFNRACLNCHAQVHGSNHPSSPYLGF
jgi:DmsE family decaheme c-type cytochrome